jgi:hypothetical protein
MKAKAKGSAHDSLSGAEDIAGDRRRSRPEQRRPEAHRRIGVGRPEPPDRDRDRAGAVRPGHRGPIDDGQIDAGISGLIGVAPRDETEGMKSEE